MLVNVAHYEALYNTLWANENEDLLQRNTLLCFSGCTGLSDIGDTKKYHLTNQPTVGVLVPLDSVLLVSTMHGLHKIHLYGNKGSVISRFQILAHVYFRCLCVHVCVLACSGSFMYAEARGLSQGLSLGMYLPPLSRVSLDTGLLLLPTVQSLFGGR